MNVLKAETPIKAWEKLVENFISKNPEWFKEGSGYNLTNSLYTYDLAVEIEEAKFEPDFDFGKIFGYTVTKWTGLLTNYLDLDILDEVRDTIRSLEDNKTVNRNYHLGFHFADNHGSGKGCLVGGVFSRKLGVDKPEITIMLRSSDVVMRLPIDILMFCRLGEYVYGHSDFKLTLILKAAYADDIVILMYNTHKDIKELISNCKDEFRRKKLKKSLRKLMKGDESTYRTYGHNLRTFKMLRTDLDYPRPKPLISGKLEIGNWEGVPLPPKCPSAFVRNQIKAKYMKFVNQYGLEMIAKQETKRKKLISFSTEGDDYEEDAEVNQMEEADDKD